MATSINNENEGIYYRAILFSNNDFSSLLNLFHEDEIAVKRLKINNCKFPLYNIFINYPKEPPLYLAKYIPINKDGNFTYKLFGFDIISNNTKYFFIASPILDLLLKKTEIFNNKYHLCNLKKFCNRNLLDIDRKNLRIARLTARINDEKSNLANSIVLYGEDILKSNIIRYILEGKYWDFQNGENNIQLVDMYNIIGEPFTPIGKIPKIEPNSCKIILNIEADTTNYGLNIDKYGNYSFYLKSEQNILGLIKIIETLFELKLLEGITEYNPLLRSDEALNEI